MHIFVQVLFLVFAQFGTADLCLVKVTNYIHAGYAAANFFEGRKHNLELHEEVYLTVVPISVKVS